MIVICNAGCHYLLSKYLTMVKGNTNTIDAYFKRRRTDQESVNEDPSTHPPPLFQLEQQNQEELEVQRNNEQVLFRGIEFLERDPAKRPQIWQYPPNQRDVVKRAYLNLGPMQPLLQTYIQAFWTTTPSTPLSVSLVQLFPIMAGVFREQSPGILSILLCLQQKQDPTRWF